MSNEAPPKNDDNQERREASSCIALGIGVGALGVGGAILSSAVCPICFIVAPGLVGAGVYKHRKLRRKRAESAKEPTLRSLVITLVLGSTMSITSGCVNVYHAPPIASDHPANPATPSAAFDIQRARSIADDELLSREPSEAQSHRGHGAMKCGAM